MLNSAPPKALDDDQQYFTGSKKKSILTKLGVRCFNFLLHVLFCVKSVSNFALYNLFPLAAKLFLYSSK